MSNYSNKADPVYAEAAFKVLHSAGQVTRQAYLEMFLDMEQRYPGLGWIEQMNELEEFYEKYKLPLDKFPRSREIGR